MRKSVRDPAREGDGEGEPRENDSFYDARKKAWEQKVSYGVDNEVQFINGLGYWWNPPARTRRPSRKYLLEKYLITLDQRTGFTPTEVAVLKAKVLVALEAE